jgi:sugar phosphate isomerase/epimerase
MPDRLAIDYLSLMSLPPVDSVRLVDELGCRAVGVSVTPYAANPEEHPIVSLVDDAAQRRAMADEMAARGVTLGLAEGFIVVPRRDIAGAAATLDVMSELGALRVNVFSFEPDLARTMDQIAIFAGLSVERGLRATVEFVPGLVIGDLPTAMAVLDHVGATLQLSLDCMHLCRSDGTAEDVAKLDPQRIGYAQLCDVPLAPQVADYGDEATNHRLPPGEGELPLADILRALPRDVPIGLEIPMLTAAQQGVGPYERLAPCVRAARALLDDLERGGAAA